MRISLLRNILKKKAIMKFVEYPEEKKTEPGKDPEGNVQGGRMPNGNMFWTIILMFAFLVLINTFLFPGGKGNSVVETDYGSSSRTWTADASTMS